MVVFHNPDYGGYAIRTCSLLIFIIVTVTLLPVCAHTAGPDESAAQKDWQFSAGSGLIVAPAFTGARNYSLLAVPDIRAAYRDLFFANIRDGIGYALFKADGWRIGPVVTYTFSRSESSGGSVFRVAGGGKSALQGMGDVPGTVSFGGFAEYSLKPYKLQLHLHQGLNGHKGLVAEGRVSYGGVMRFAGPPLIYAFGPHIRYGDQDYTNAYWGITPEQSARTGLAQYRADAGITAYGVNVFALMPLTESVTATLTAGFDRLAPPAAHSPLIRSRGTEDQAFGGLIFSYGF